jgi:hypothetical protein
VTYPALRTGSRIASHRCALFGFRDDGGGVFRRRVPRTRIERIVREEIGVTPDTALRLAKFFETTPEFWMDFQTA